MEIIITLKSVVTKIGDVMFDLVELVFGGWNVAMVWFSMGGH